MNKIIHRPQIIILCSIVIVSTLMHLPHFQKELISIHTWRQTQTQSTINNFYAEDMNILNPRRNNRGDTAGVFRMEFPLMQWLTAVLYKIFGNHLIISRLFMFAVGLLSVLGLYTLLKNLFHNALLAAIGAWAFNFSPSFYYYTINPMPDNLALCFGIWGLAKFFAWRSNAKRRDLWLCGLFLSLSTLCKLPFIFLYIVPFHALLQSGIQQKFDRKLWLHGIEVFGLSLLPLTWYIAVIPSWHGSPVVTGMLDNPVGIGRLLEYYQHTIISTLPELLLNYGSVLFFVVGIGYAIKYKAYQHARFAPFISLGILLTLFYLFEANVLGKVHDYYFFPFLSLLFIAVGYGGFKLYQSRSVAMRVLAIVLLVLLPVTCHLRMQDRWDMDEPGFNKDLLTYKTELRKVVPDDALVVAGNDESHFIFFYYIDKKGWSFTDDYLPADHLKEMIRRGATALYTDSNLFDRDTSYACCLDSLVLQAGSIRVYDLKDVNQLH